MLLKVFEQVNSQEDKTIGLVKDGQVYYLVMNRPDNMFDFNYMQKISDYLDVVSKDSGPRVLVTIGTGPKIFSTGFDFKCWMAAPNNPFHAAIVMQQLLGKLVSLNVPTMCVMNGHAYAGGFIFGLCHDFRIIQANGVLCLSEINNGLPLPPAYNTICSELLPKQLARKMNFGTRISAKEAVQHSAVNEVYQDLAEAEKHIGAFTKEYAKRAEVG